MLRSIQESLSGMRGRVSGSGGPLRLLLVIAISIVLLVAAFWIVDRVFVFFLARSYVDEIADALEINKYLANAISWVAFAVTVFLFGLTFSLSRRKRRLGVLGVLALLVGQSLVLWYGTKRNIIDRCYVITKDVAQPVRFGNHPGTVDQETGRICRPVTPEIVDRLRSYEKGEVPKRIEVAEPTFFDPRTAEAIVWYSKTSGGSVELFNLMGFHPRTGDELLPVTKEIAALWKTQSQAPKRVFPDGSYQFFDLTTGESRLWYLLALNGEFEFYDRAGFSPLTGEPFSKVDRDVLAEWKKYVTANPAKQCYVITKDTVLYKDNPGIDPVTGRQCRPFTVEMLERLRQYEKGNRPKRIQEADPTFFDLGTGDPIVWYYKNKDGRIELFDLMGFHPESGDELLPVTKDVVELWKKQVATRVPTPVDLNNYAPFDPKTGEARVWYWRSDKGDWVFYNSPGFHPATGEPLKVFNKETTEQFRTEAAAQQKRMEDERLQREKEKRERTERENSEKLAREKKEQDEKKSREAQRQRETEAANRCDELAGNPTDPKRSNDGATYELLKSKARDAVAACELAVSQYPTELRLQYEYGRAMQFVDRKKAFVIQQKLVNQGYPAAYDNLGWMFFADRKNIPEAVNLFRKGTQLGDPDSMVSLAEMIDRGHTTPMNGDETKMALYGRAAAMGHPAAARALQVEQEKEIKEEQQRLVQQQQQQLMLQIIGGVVQNLGRR